jgi:hypothetical protein
MHTRQLSGQRANQASKAIDMTVGRQRWHWLAAWWMA